MIAIQSSASFSAAPGNTERRGGKTHDPAAPNHEARDNHVMATKTSTTPTRRSVLRNISLTAIAAGLAVPALASAAPDDADAALIRLCAQASDCEDLLRKIDGHGTSEEKCNAATDDWDRVFRRIAETRATTTDGIRAKARALYLAMIREAAMEHGFDYFDRTSPPISAKLLR
jgi:hypothetical protein